MKPKREYTVFIDESFNGFMDMARNDGYFCYASLMLPTDRIEELGFFWQHHKRQLQEAYLECTGYRLPPDSEFKSGFLRQIKGELRLEKARKLAYFLRKNEAYIGGFFTTVESYLLYHLRTQIALENEKAVSLPDDCSKLLEELRTKMLEEKRREIGDSRFIRDLLLSMSTIAIHWLGSGGHPMRLVFDPRSPREDRKVSSFIGEHGLRIINLLLDNSKELFRGISATVASHECPGLMLADLIAAEIRNFFLDFPEARAEHSSKKFILPIPQDDEVIVRKLGGTLMKTGSRYRMTEATQSKIFKPTRLSMLAVFSDRLADEKLSCNGLFGEARIVNFREKAFDHDVD